MGFIQQTMGYPITYKQGEKLNQTEDLPHRIPSPRENIRV